MNDIPDENLTISVTSVTTRDNCDNISVNLLLTDGVNRERKTVVLLPDVYSQLEIIIGEIDRDKYKLICNAGKLCEAIRHGIASLSVSDQSGRKLIEKLIGKGASRNTAQAAVAYLKSRGYINEEKSVLQAAERYADKLWGFRRIMTKLYADGYSQTALREAEAFLREYEFEENCAELIRKKWKRLPEDRDAFCKMRNSLQGYGYSSDEIRKAVEIVRKIG